MDTRLNASNWTECKRQLRPLCGKAVFQLERSHSLNDGKFLRVLHKVKPHELVFYDGEKLAYLTIPKERESELQFFENGFIYQNCTYTLLQVKDEKEATR